MERRASAEVFYKATCNIFLVSASSLDFVLMDTFWNFFGIFFFDTLCTYFVWNNGRNIGNMHKWLSKFTWGNFGKSAWILHEIFRKKKSSLPFGTFRKTNSRKKIIVEIPYCEVLVKIKNVYLKKIVAFDYFYKNLNCWAFDNFILLKITEIIGWNFV